MSKRIVILPDFQMPFEDRKALKALIKFVGDFQPDELIHIGDLLDFPQPSRWSKGTREEFEGSIFEDCEAAKSRFLGPLREVYAGPFGIHTGNHDSRPADYLRKYAPALADSGAFDLKTLLDMDQFDADPLPTFYNVAPGWITTHGHLGGISLSQISGNTALNAAKKFGTSVVIGHCHRLGIGSHTTGYGGDVKKTVTGMEVGHIMNQKMAQYLKSGTGNWQQGFGLLTVEGQHVTPTVIPISRGKFSVDGHTWEV